jgi:parallel beta-helix repeat protein
MVLVGGTSLAIPAGAATFYVDKNDASCSNSGAGSSAQPFCSISTAAARVVAGDSVVVRAASYSERVRITRSGTASAPITFAGDAGATVMGQTYGFDIAAQWVTIQGFTVASTTSDGIRCILCTSVTIMSNQVKDAKGRGIYIRDSSNMTLMDNVVERSVSHGIYLQNDTNFTISGGSVSGSGHQVKDQTRKGIYVTGCSDSTITGTEVFDNSDNGIYLISSTKGVRVKGTLTHGNARGWSRAAAGVETRSDGNIIETNIGYDNEDSAINMRWGGSNTPVFNNIGYANGDHGIDALESPGARIIGNSVFDNVTAGINVEGNSTGATIFNNISVDNGINSPRTRSNIRVSTSSTPGTTMDYNVVYLSTSGDMYHWNGSYYKSLSALHAAAPDVEVHAIQADPAWVAPASGDFHLKAGSPGIDSADSGVSGAPAVDAEGNARVDDPATANSGAGPRDYDDRGALEFLAGGSLASGAP